ncbi:MAG: Lrp/AsnC family transcriptional regulator [bacterium]
MILGRESMAMDLDKKVLKAIQGEFPLEKQPFKVIGERIGLDENSVIEIVLSLKNKGIIREIGPIFDHKRLGLETKLVGIAVKDIESCADIINEYEEVTHNYEREGFYNLWCSIVGEKGRVDNLIEIIKQRVKPDDIVSLPSISSFKLLFELEIYS